MLDVLIGPIARILLRYASGALVTYGAMGAPLADQIANDPDVLRIGVIVVGAALGALSEIGYALAKRWGWAT